MAFVTPLRPVSEVRWQPCGSLSLFVLLPVPVAVAFAAVEIAVADTVPLPAPLIAEVAMLAGDTSAVLETREVPVAEATLPVGAEVAAVAAVDDTDPVP